MRFFLKLRARAKSTAVFVCGAFRQLQNTKSTCDFRTVVCNVSFRLLLLITLSSCGFSFLPKHSSSRCRDAEHVPSIPVKSPPNHASTSIPSNTSPIRSTAHQRTSTIPNARTSRTVPRGPGITNTGTSSPAAFRETTS